MQSSLVTFFAYTVGVQKRVEKRWACRAPSTFESSRIIIIPSYSIVWEKWLSSHRRSSLGASRNFACRGQNCTELKSCKGREFFNHIQPYRRRACRQTKVESYLLDAAMLIASGGLLATGLQLRQLQTREKILNFWGQAGAAAAAVVFWRFAFSANCSQLLCFCLDKVKTCATSLGLHAGAVFPLAVVRRENFFKQSLLSYHCHFQIMATRVRKDGIRQERDTFSPLFKVSSARSIALKPHRLICLCH